MSPCLACCCTRWPAQALPGVAHAPKASPQCRNAFLLSPEVIYLNFQCRDDIRHISELVTNQGCLVMPLTGSSITSAEVHKLYYICIWAAVHKLQRALTARGIVEDHARNWSDWGSCPAAAISPTSLICLEAYLKTCNLAIDAVSHEQNLSRQHWQVTHDAATDDNDGISKTLNPLINYYYHHHYYNYCCYYCYYGIVWCRAGTEDHR